MDRIENDDWKTKLGFKINYESEPSSGDDFDEKDVVMRRPRQSSGYLLEDEGDGAEADLLGTTPPRMRIRSKEKRRTIMGLDNGSPRFAREPPVASTETPVPQERIKKRLSLKMLRSKERDWKQDSTQRGSKADSLPSPGTPIVPTLVESCNRFMSLSSKLKCRSSCTGLPLREPRTTAAPESRVAFHTTFSMLINMGNVDKSCRRTISREEQVWQSELKDMIWLEIQAKLAGRTLAQQDAYLCSQRNLVPQLIQNIIDYRFVNENPCKGSKGLCKNVSREDLTDLNDDGKHGCDNLNLGCVSFTCQSCTGAIGKAIKELGSLLDALYNAIALYPSTKAMMSEHPLFATQLFHNRVKAMCLWYNTALHMRLKLNAVLKLVRTIQQKNRRNLQHLISTESDASRISNVDTRHTQVRFNVNGNLTDSNNSDLSSQSEGNRSEGDVNVTVNLTPADCQGQVADCPNSENKADLQEANSESNFKNNELIEGDGDSKECNEKSIPINCEQELPTPEYTLNDKFLRYDSYASYSSNDSGYLSSQSAGCDGMALRDLTNMRLFDKVPVSPFRNHHYEILKTQGVRRCMQFVNKMRKHILARAYWTLEKPDDTATLREETPIEVFNDTTTDDKTENQDEEAQRNEELRRFGCWSEESLAMRLPSYRNHFLLLSCICMETVHDYLSMRLEDRPEHPSCLTIKQLIHELKEGLDIATATRAVFVKNIACALRDYPAAQSLRCDLLLVLQIFDATVDTLLAQYLSYVSTMSQVESLSRQQLNAEWAFAATLAARRTAAASQAPAAFAKIACNQIDRLVEQFRAKFLKVDEMAGGEANNLTQGIKTRAIYTICREAQNIFVQEREATLQAATWGRALAARLARAPPPAYLTNRDGIFNSLISMRDCIVHHLEFILARSQVAEDNLTYDTAVLSRVRELLLQGFRLGFDLHRELFKFAQEPFSSSVKRQKRPASLQPVRETKEVGRKRRPETMLVHESVNPLIHKELHRFVKDASIQNSARNSYNGPIRCRVRFNRSESIVEDETAVFDEQMFENINNPNGNQTSIEVLLCGDVPPLPDDVTDCPVKCDIDNDIEEKWAKTVAYAIVKFAKCWMKFVVTKCERGRGRRPRWASQGLEFLMLACDPNNTKHLTDDEFEELKSLMDACISHVVGSRTRPPSPTPPPLPKPRHKRLQSPLSTNPNKDAPTPPTPPPEHDALINFVSFNATPHQHRVIEAISALESSLASKRQVGRVLETRRVYEPKLKQVTFKWQRGLKIGAGTFGKVYTVVNTESGQLLAMKELSIVAGDRRALQRAANELQVLEGVIHPHLVRYYGCELHREEMLIFMELCVEGSLEALICSSGALVEHTVRRYSKQLVSAVTELHARNIAHRDIKSGNIFLTNEGNCLKLGDFGCAVKIRANTTAPGELQGFVGTQAYMAPEVFMKTSGHGRAADVWSLGCVVTEMASGKRPFSEYDSNYQIMFVVGMGGRPEVPPCLSEEGQQFCMSCLTHDPDDRPKIETLGLHHFLMVKSDDDCNCEPGYLKT